MPIALTKNEIKKLRSLGQSKYRQRLGLFIAEGPKLVGELIGNSLFSIETLYFTKGATSPAFSAVSAEISEEDLGKISQLSTPNSVLAVVRIPNQSKDDFPSEGPVLVLDGIQDPGNVGTIIRTADWFGIKSVVLGANCADVYGPKTVQASMGSLFRVNCITGEMGTILEKLKTRGYQLSLADMDGTDLSLHRFESNSAIVMGSEGQGPSEIAKKCCPQKLNVKRYGQAESLNVSVAAGIICNAYRQQFPAIV